MLASRKPCGLMPLRAGLNASGKQDTIGLLKAIAFARINEVDILNMSFWAFASKYL